MPRSNARRNVAGASVAVAVVTLLAAGVVGTLVLGPQRTPASLAPTGGPALVGVGRETFDDVRQVAVTVEQSTGVDLNVRGEGLVTRTSCAPGAVVTSGSSPLTVDDRRVLALATSEPLWRDLGPGAKGSDVLALQTELQRLGHPVRPDGAYGRSTGSAVKELQRAAGTPTPTDALTAASVMWLPAPQVTLATCDVGLAEAVTDGAFATTASTVTALVLAEDVTGAVPGERVVRVGDTAGPVDAAGRGTDPTLRAAFAAAAAGRVRRPRGARRRGRPRHGPHAARGVRRVRGVAVRAVGRGRRRHGRAGEGRVRARHPGRGAGRPAGRAVRGHR